MIKLNKLLSEIMEDASIKNLNEWEATIYEESRLFQEIANPEFAYEYKEVFSNVWEFNDRYGNTIGVRFYPSNKEFESYYIVKTLDGGEAKIFDYDITKKHIDPTSFQGGSDEHRSDTICKILLDEVLPNYLLNSKPSIVKLHPLNDYRYKIFMKCAEICKEKYPNIEIKPLGKEIHLINK
jgi:hypothetical protein